MNGDPDHGELRYELSILIGPCYEQDAEELADILAGIVNRNPWGGAVSLTRIEDDDGPNTQLRPYVRH